MIHPSTFSIAAFDPAENAFGVAVASKFLAVGAVVPFAKAGVGAIATQSYANLSYGKDGLKMLARGMSAQEVVNRLTADDDHREQRQLGVVDRMGNAATYTGAGCYDWAGGVTGNGFAAQGNILASAQVVPAMARAFEAATGDLAARLLAALSAGDDAGGDKRGKQGAALYVVKPGGSYGGYTDRYIDLRVDDHAEPTRELARLLTLHRLFFGQTPANEKISLTAALVSELQAAAKRHGTYAGAIDGVLNDSTRAALREFVGNENLEERIDLDAGTIDPPALEHIRRYFGA